MTTAILEAHAIRKDYGGITVLRGIDLAIEPGEAHVIIGPNGAGKTTLFKVLSGEVSPASGKVVFDGQDITPLAGWQRTRLGIGRTFQSAHVFKDLTTLENLIVSIEINQRVNDKRFGILRLAAKPSVRKAAEELLGEFQLEDVADWTAAALSHGDKKSLELAMVIAARPRLLMLDEPTAGMAPADRQRSVAMISRLLKAQGLSLLLTEHDMEVVFSLADRITVLNYGEMIATGSPEDVRNNPRVREVYLGHDVTAA